MRSTNLPSERPHLLQFIHRSFLILLCPDQSKRARATLSIANSLIIQREAAFPPNTNPLPKPAMRHRDTGTHQNTMLTIQCYALPKATRAVTQSHRRSAGTKTKAWTMSSLPPLLRTHPGGRLGTRRPSIKAVSGLMARRRLFIEVTWLDRRWTS